MAKEVKKEKKAKKAKKGTALKVAAVATGILSPWGIQGSILMWQKGNELDAIDRMANHMDENRYEDICKKTGQMTAEQLKTQTSEPEKEETKEEVKTEEVKEVLKDEPKKA